MAVMNRAVNQTKRMCCVAALALFTLAARLHAAPPPLPAEAMSEFVVGVIWFDLQQIDAAKLKAAVDKGFGRYARYVSDRFAIYQQLHTSLTRAGCTSVAVIYFDPYAVGRTSANPLVLFSMLAAANRQAVAAVATDFVRATRVAAGALDTEGAKNLRLKSEMTGQWLALYGEGEVFPIWQKDHADDAGRAQLFKSALAPIVDHPIVGAFIPNRNLPGAYLEESGLDPITPPAVKDFNKRLLQVRSLSAAVTLGEEPAIDVSASFPDAELAASVVAYGKRLVAALDPVMRRNSLRGTRLDLINPMAQYYGVLAYHTPQAAGDKLTLRLSGQGLVNTAERVAWGLAQARDEELVLRSLNQMKALLVAINAYAADHGGHYPETLDALGESNFVASFKQLIIHPRTRETPGYIYIKPTMTMRELLEDVRKRREQKQTNIRASLRPMLYEAKNGRIDPNGLIGYFDGYVDRPDVKE
jgi:hypothetical protein